MMMMILNDSISSSSSPTFWSSLTNWFTPTIFFLLLQLVIATIYITSNLTHHKHQNHQEQHHHHHQQQQQHPLEPNNNFFQHQNPIPRSPSLLHRLKSINFYYHHHEHQEPQQHQHEHHHQQERPLEPNNLFQQQNPLPRSPSLLQRLKSINFYYHHEHHEHHQQQNQQQPPQILRSPSSMLQKLKSINLYSYLPTDPMSYFTNDTNRTHQEKTHVREIETAPGKNQQYQSEEEEDDDEEEENDVVGEINWTNNNNHIESELGNSTMDEIFSRLQEGQNGNFSRTNSDTKPSSGEVPVKLARKMKKSASTKSAFSHFEEVDIVERRRPATVKEGSAAAAVTEEGDGGVDAKADDFINRFKQQLKLQRLDSIMRYKEMLGRGTGK